MDDVIVVCDNENYKIIFTKVRYEYKVGVYIRQIIFDKREGCELSTVLEWDEATFAELFHKIQSLNG